MPKNVKIKVNVKMPRLSVIKKFAGRTLRALPVITIPTIKCTVPKAALNGFSATAVSGTLSGIINYQSKEFDLRVAMKASLSLTGANALPLQQ